VLGCSLSAALRVISPHVGEGGGRDTDAYKRIQAIQDDLFAVVKEMLLFLFHKGENDEKVGSPLTFSSSLNDPSINTINTIGVACSGVVSSPQLHVVLHHQSRAP
jgi:hypothetical protein